MVEFVDGPSLGRLLRRRCQPGRPLAVELAAKIGSALDYAHGREVIHCDLKPDNIMLSWAGTTVRPRILDFGLAVVQRRDDQERITAVGRVAGTIPYMAPEQFEGAVLTPACDVYALGILLQELLTGVSPFAGSAPWPVYHAKHSATEGLTAEGLPADLAEVVAQCTRADPRRRPSAREVAAQLQRLACRAPAPAVPAVGRSGGVCLAAAVGRR